MAKKGKLQISLEYFVARALLTSLGLLPRSLAIAFGLFVAHLSYLCFGHLRRVGMRNVELAFPSLNEKERKRLVLGCFKSLGRQLGEVSQFPKATKESLSELVEFQYSDEDLAKYEQAKAERRGMIFITPHLGGWEILVFATSALREPLSYLVRRIDNPRIETMVENIRTRFGNKPIDKTEAALPALRVLREGGILGILADLNSQTDEGVFVPFFGRMACTTAGVAALAMRTNALIVPICAPWDEKKKKYVICVGPFLEFESTGDRRRDVVINTARFTEIFEQMIREYPDQWLWIHKRWKTRPNGEPDLYKRTEAQP
jgi:KDO2-lipid IV(A) lauroyltransferase